MKKIVLFLILALFLFACQTPTDKTGDNTLDNKDNFTIKGKMDGGAGSQLIVSKVTGTKVVNIDTLSLDKEGSYNYTGYTEAPEFFILSTGFSNYVQIIVSAKDNITLNADVKSIGSSFTTEGSQDCNLLKELNNKVLEASKELEDLNNLYNTKLAEGADTLKTQEEMQGLFLAIIDKQKKFSENFINTNPSSLATMIALTQKVGGNAPVFTIENDQAVFEKVSKNLSEKHPKSIAVGLLSTSIAKFNEMEAGKLKEQEGKPQIGDMAAEIKLPTPEGTETSLSSLKGKYVLLDFWASWCGPCRKESPTLIASYAKYKNKNFTIYQVSLDKTAEDWKTAIKKDQLSDWHHVSDLLHWKCAPAQAYHVRGIPANFLLDPSGKIIATNLRGPALDAKLAEVLK